MQWIAKSRLVRPDNSIIEPGEILPPMRPRTVHALLRGGHIVQAIEGELVQEEGHMPTPDAWPESVTMIPGIGPERAADLAAMEIYDLRDLAAADPAAIERQMVKVSIAMVRQWQDYARMLEEGEVDGEQRDSTGDEETNAPCAHCGN